MSNLDILLIDLERILEGELGCYLSLIELAKRQQDALIKNRIDDIFQVTREMENCTIDIRRKEADRLALMARLKEFLPLKAKDPTLNQLLEHLEDPSKSRYRTMQEKLLQAMKEVHFLNQHNASLVKHSLQYTNYLMTLFTGATEGPVYGVTGEKKAQDSRKLIDSQA